MIWLNMNYSLQMSLTECEVILGDFDLLQNRTLQMILTEFEVLFYR